MFAAFFESSYPVTEEDDSEGLPSALFLTIKNWDLFFLALRVGECIGLVFFVIVCSIFACQAIIRTATFHLTACANFLASSNTTLAL
ncbi:MAG: hypothetical protein ACYC4K_02755 [Thiobacillus sp.]